MQQVRRADDASQSVQGLRLLQQKRDHSSGLRTTETMRKKDQEECPVAVFFLIFFNWGQGIFNLGRGISENTTSPIE